MRPSTARRKQRCILFFCFEWRFGLLKQNLITTGPRNGSNAAPCRRTINRRNLFGAQFREL
jgi:hypothetical protein